MIQRAAVVGWIVLAALCGPARAQYPFGKNKVIYQGRDWRVLQTEHVDIYHYAPDSTLIVYLAPLVEETYREFASKFRVEFDRRLPFVFYATHYDFQQTNILPILISEFTGGFTDLIKGRIAVPANGSYAALRHVARHEMVHAFMLEKLSRTMQEQGKFTYSHPPLWFVEGMAEYFANSPQNSEGEMFVRDALLSGRLYPLEEIWRIEGTYMMYKHGEAVLNYIATNFGEDAIVRILEKWWTSGEFTLVLDNTLGMDVRELDQAFQRYVKRRYFPSLLGQTFATDAGTQITPDRTFHSRPAVIQDPSGERVVFALSARDGAVVVARGTGSVRKKNWREEILLSGGSSRRLESIPAFRSKLEVHGDTLIFVSKSNDRDRIYFYDVEKRRMLAQFEFSDLALISSPTRSGDGSKLVFSAIDTRGRMDLYLLHVASQRLERLTDDAFSEEDPDYHPHHDLVLFTSDRGAGEDRNRRHIYRMDLASREVTAIEGGPHSDWNPEWVPKGNTFLFTSDREGTPNIYLHRGDTIVRQTRVVTGVSVPNALPDGSAFVASVYERGEFHLYEFPLRDGNGELRPSPPDTTVVPWQRLAARHQDFVSKPYETRFGVDFVGAGVAVDPGAGDVGNGGQLVLTDVLGNHQINLVFGTTTEDFEDFWRNFNAAVVYVNLAHRVNYSVGGFHLNTNSFERVSSKEEKRVGGAFGISYPLNKFERVEAATVVRYLEQRDLFSLTPRHTVTGSLFGTYVRDNSLWTFGGPLTGWRYYITGGPTLDFQRNGFDNTILQLDVRRYFKLSTRAVFALRYITRSSWGIGEQVFYLGGPWTLRGYDYNEFFGRTTQLFNAEIRFPLLDGLSIVFPFGPIELPMFRGALFFDAGRATRNEADFFDTVWLGTFGTGVELNVGFAPIIRVNFTWATDFITISNDSGFELFIGYNY